MRRYTRGWLVKPGLSPRAQRFVESGLALPAPCPGCGAKALRGVTAAHFYVIAECQQCGAVWRLSPPPDYAYLGLVWRAHWRW